ncbi:MAG: hypothetical protein FH762_09720 [Firmicutes bacterium]|nr:hypothetical protein [Bacillota bacterium]
MKSSYGFIDFKEMYNNLDFGSTESLKIESFDNKVYFRNLIEDMYYGDSLKGLDSGAYRYINITNLSKDGVNYYKEDKFVNTDDDNKAVITKKDVGDILVSRSRKPGVFSQITEKEVGKVFGSFIIKIEIKDIYKPFIDYLVFYLNSPIVQHYLNTKKSGGVGGNINQRIINKIPIIKCNFSYLKKQQTNLPLVKSEIQKLKKQIEYINEKKQRDTVQNIIDRIFKQKLSVTSEKSGFKYESRFFYNKFNESNDRLGFKSIYLDNKSKKVFKSYQMKKVRQYVKYVARGDGPRTGFYTNKEPKFPFVRVNNIIDFTIDLTDIKYIKKEIHEGKLERAKLKKDDLIISISGSIGEVAVIPQGFEGNINSAIIKLELNKSIEPMFLALYLKSSFGKNQIEKSSIGLGMNNINTNDVLSILVPDICKEKQNEIIVQYYKEKNNIGNFDLKISEMNEKIEIGTDKYILHGYTEDLFILPIKGGDL